MQKFVKPSEISLDILLDFFRAISKEEIKTNFNPHPFDRETAEWLFNYSGKDEYFFLVEQDKILAYGMLRGWDENYERPTLGICTHPEFQKKGYARRMMSHLIDMSKKRRVKELLLKVKKDNVKAKQLYQQFGFDLRSLNTDYDVGILRIENS